MANEKKYKDMALKDTLRKRIPDRPPVVLPVARGVTRPLWSVMIPAYNCIGFLPQTLRAVLAQDPGPGLMQVEVIDDASTDGDVGALVRDLGGGRVSYYRQARNGGSLRNFQTCIERSRGHLIHILHGDDLIREGFYRRFENFFVTHAGAGAAFCRYAYIDEHSRLMYSQEREADETGVLADWLVRLSERQRIQYVAMVVRRSVYEALGGFYGVEYGEDWEMWVRIAAHYKMGYIPDILADYRRHSLSITGRTMLTGKNMEDLKTVMRRIQRYVPEDRRAEVLRKSRKYYAYYAMRAANTLWTSQRHRAGALSQLRAAWGMWQDVRLAFMIGKLFTRMTLNL